MTTYLSLAPMLRMNGCIHELPPYLPAWLVQGKYYLYFLYDEQSVLI